MKKFFYLGGACTGALSVIFAFVIKAASIGSFVSNQYYGGDAYTGIQQAAAQTGNNVQDLADIARFGFFAVLLIFGILAVCYFVPMFLGELEKEKNAASSEKTQVLSEELPDL